MEILQVIAGLITIIFGLIIMKFPSFFSMTILDYTSFPWTTVKRKYGKEKGAKMVYYIFGLTILIVGVYLLLTGILGIKIG